MNKIKIAYWISTIFITLMMLNSSYMCFASPFLIKSIAHLGFPNYFRFELGVSKLLGAIILIIPPAPRKIKEFVYSGFIIMFCSGIIAHFVSGDSATMWGAGIFALIILTTSYVSYQKLQAKVNHPLNSQV